MFKVESFKRNVPDTFEASQVPEFEDNTFYMDVFMCLGKKSKYIGSLKYISGDEYIDLFEFPLEMAKIFMTKHSNYNFEKEDRCYLRKLPADHDSDLYIKTINYFPMDPKKEYSSVQTKFLPMYVQQFYQYIDKGIDDFPYIKFKLNN